MGAEVLLVRALRAELVADQHAVEEVENRKELPALVVALRRVHVDLQGHPRHSRVVVPHLDRSVSDAPDTETS